MTVLETQLADRTVVLVTHRSPPTGRTSRILALHHGRLTSTADPVPRAGLAVTP